MKKMLLAAVVTAMLTSAMGGVSVFAGDSAESGTSVQTESKKPKREKKELTDEEKAERKAKWDALTEEEKAAKLAEKEQKKAEKKQLTDEEKAAVKAKKAEKPAKKPAKNAETTQTA